MLKNVIVFVILGILHSKAFDIIVKPKREKKEDPTFSIIVYWMVMMLSIKLVGLFITPEWYSTFAYVVGYIIQMILAHIFKD